MAVWKTINVNKTRKNSSNSDFIANNPDLLRYNSDLPNESISQKSDYLSFWFYEMTPDLCNNSDFISHFISQNPDL